MTREERAERCGRRYTTADVHKARELHAAGWTTTQVTEILQREGLPGIHRSTVYHWLNSDAADRHRDFQRRRNARDRVAANQGRFRGHFASPEFKLARIQGLHAAGLSHSEIATVMTFDFPDLGFTHGQVRHVLELGQLPSRGVLAAC